MVKEKFRSEISQIVVQIHGFDYGYVQYVWSVVRIIRIVSGSGRKGYG